MGTRLTHVPFDIETTGFDTTARVTVVGFALPLGCRVFLNTGGKPAAVSTLDTELAERFNTEIQLTAHEDESALLTAMTAFVEESIAPREFLLVAYNGDRFNGGFDLPFLRSRFALQDQQWPFDRIPYADIYPLIKDRFNTSADGEEGNDLVTAYDLLTDGDLSAVDPFDESSAAVRAFRTGDFESLLTHNVADILRTKALASLAERFCGKSEFRLKSLTPSARDPDLSSP